MREYVNFSLNNLVQLLLLLTSVGSTTPIAFDKCKFYLFIHFFLLLVYQDTTSFCSLL